MICHANMKSQNSGAAAAIFVSGFLTLVACGGEGVSGVDANWYYHFICNGDSECRSTNFTPNNAPEGTSNQGPGQGGQAGCDGLMNFGNNFWNIPPAQQWCDRVASIPPPITISGFTPATGAPGTAITVTGTGFPSRAADLTVTFGSQTVTLTSISATQLRFDVPTSGNGNYVISVRRPIPDSPASRQATAPGTFKVEVPNPLGSAPIKKIAPGVNHTCAIMADDTVKCWGNNTSGQLGNGSTIATSSAVTVTGVVNAIDIASGNSFSCAVVGAAPAASSGSVVCWGLGTTGQLGNGSNASSSSAVAAGSMTDAIQVTARTSHACALRSPGQVMCWGAGTSGQLGNNALANSAVPVAVQGLGPDNYGVVNAETGEASSTKAFQVSAGSEHTCARVSISSGSAGLGVKCWGAKNHGELGNGAALCQVNTICDPKAPDPVPRRVSNLITAVHLAVGGHHSCTVLNSGGVRCWGRGDQGQLGNGNTLRSSTPVTVSGVSGATHAAAGDAFACAATGSALKCWGDNSGGQLGNGGINSSSTAVTATAIDAGTFASETLRGGDLETCLKRNNDTAFCFPSG